MRAQAVPRETWEALFRAQGMQHPSSRMRMLDGFNEGWIAFEGHDNERRTGTLPLEEVVRRLVDAADAPSPDAG